MSEINSSQFAPQSLLPFPLLWRSRSWSSCVSLTVNLLWHSAPFSPRSFMFWLPCFLFCRPVFPFYPLFVVFACFVAISAIVSLFSFAFNRYSILTRLQSVQRSELKHNGRENSSCRSHDLIRSACPRPHLVLPRRHLHHPHSGSLIWMSRFSKILSQLRRDSHRSPSHSLEEGKNEGSHSLSAKE